MYLSDHPTTEISSPVQFSFPLFQFLMCVKSSQDARSLVLSRPISLTSKNTRRYELPCRGTVRVF